MSAFLRMPETAVPGTRVRQETIRDLFADQPEMDRRAARIVRAAFDGAAIETRYTVIDQFDAQSPAEGPFFDRASGWLLHPGTAVRNEIHGREGTPLAIEAARRALASAPDLEPAAVTHLITVSCTGFHAPGIDLAIQKALGLCRDTQRYHLGFMGCGAAIPALRAAAQFCDANPQAVVLVVSVEICTVHLRASRETDAILSASLFADGAAAVLVTARPPEASVRAAELDGFSTAVAEDSEDRMGWTIGDHGFEMRLSTAVPRVIEAHAADAVRALCADDPELRLACDEDALASLVGHWAVHPGGREILDRIGEVLGLSPQQLEHSRDVLREYGNMSSATVLFVLRRILQQPDLRTGERILGMAFGPGLTMEGMALTALGGADATA